MVSRRHVELGSQDLEQTVPEVAREARVSIGDERVRQTMLSKHNVDKDLSTIRASVSVTHWCKMHHLGQSIHEHEHTIVPSRIRRQTKEKVHAH